MTRENDALQYILVSWVNRSKMPNNKEMATFLGSSKIWVNVRGKLMEKGKLIESDIFDFEISQDVIEDYKRIRAQVKKPLFELTNYPDYFVPASIPLLGTVRAGKDGFDELKFDESPSGDIIMLPDVERGQSVYSLEVVGESMVSDHILPDDLIIIESISLADIKENDLIVAKYLDEKFNEFDDDRVSLAINDPYNFVGPTLKYVNIVEFPKKIGGRSLKERFYRLSPKNRDSAYTIQTRALEESSLGRVVALHRPIRRL